MILGHGSIETFWTFFIPAPSARSWIRFEETHSLLPLYHIQNASKTRISLYDHREGSISPFVWFYFRALSQVLILLIRPRLGCLGQFSGLVIGTWDPCTCQNQGGRKGLTTLYIYIHYIYILWSAITRVVIL